VRCMLTRYTPTRCTPSEVHAHEIHAHEIHAHEVLSDFSGGMDELVYSIYLSSELIVIDTQTVDGPGVL
jgi:hypothetical protein